MVYDRDSMADEEGGSSLGLNDHEAFSENSDDGALEIILNN